MIEEIGQVDETHRLEAGATFGHSFFSERRGLPHRYSCAVVGVPVDRLVAAAAKWVMAALA